MENEIIIKKLKPNSDGKYHFIFMENHHCPICLVTKNNFTVLYNFIKHLKEEHDVDFFNYLNDYNVKIFLSENFESEEKAIKQNLYSGYKDHSYYTDYSRKLNKARNGLPVDSHEFTILKKDMFNAVVERLSVEQKPQYETSNIEKSNENNKAKKPFINIDGEIVKRIKIGKVYSYKRRMTKKKRIGGEIKVIKGLVKKDLLYIPDVDENFMFEEEFHFQTIKVMQNFNSSSLLLSGDTGLGKTETVRQICAKMNQPVLRLKITGNTKVKDIFQDENYDKEEKKIVKVDKGIIKAMKNGWTLLVDEISAGSPTVNFIFFELLENNSVIDYDDNVIYPHHMFKIIFTDNRIGNPNYFRYHGTLEQNAAFVNRIETIIKFDNLNVNLEKKILKKKFPEIGEGFLEKLNELSTLLRSENKNGNYSNTFPIRTLEKICHNFLIFENEKDAIFLGYINSLTELEDKIFVNDICNRIFGSSIFPQL